MMRVTECFVRPIGTKAAITVNVDGTTLGGDTFSASLNTGDVLELAESFESAARWLRSLQPAPEPVQSEPLTPEVA